MKAEKDDIKVVLEMIIPRLIQTIVERRCVTEREAFTLLYSSELYRQIENPSTKLWHLSVPCLFEMFAEEQETGKITYPEEA